MLRLLLHPLPHRLLRPHRLLPLLLHQLLHQLLLHSRLLPRNR